DCPCVRGVPRLALPELMIQLASDSKPKAAALVVESAEERSATSASGGPSRLHPMSRSITADRTATKTPDPDGMCRVMLRSSLRRDLETEPSAKFIADLLREAVAMSPGRSIRRVPSRSVRARAEI